MPDYSTVQIHYLQLTDLLSTLTSCPTYVTKLLTNYGIQYERYIEIYYTVVCLNTRYCSL